MRRNRIKRGWKRRRGWGPWRENWASICSGHMDYDENCRLCTKGQWFNHWKWLVSHAVFKLFPMFWVWWVNR